MIFIIAPTTLQLPFLNILGEIYFK